ncbi:MAG: hypothetical protein EOM85_01890 [Candidatus Moranbacteria bacterium]|nr:hypothetical protein [Candidatus Moranbacteria bacterium]
MKRIGFVIFGDFVAFWVSLFIILTTRYTGSHSEIIARHFYPFFILFIAWTLIFFLFDLYDIYNIKPTIPHLKKFGLALITSFVVGIGLFYLVPSFGITPKTNLVFQIILFGVISFSFRRFFYALSTKQIVRPAIMIGDSLYIKKLDDAISLNPQIGIRVIFRSNDLEETIKNFVMAKNTTFIIDTNSINPTTSSLVEINKNNNSILDVAEAYEKFLHQIPVDYISESWILENISPKKSVLYRVISRVSEVLFAIFILIVTSPILLIVAICIKLEDRGQIFYSQTRLGINETAFKLIKIRSMVILSSDGGAETNGAVWMQKDDPRVTKVGRIIRKLHIDEIPQMINIIRGDIALFGPRPERPEFVKELILEIPHYEIRNIIKPGFTGWAQIKYQYANSILTSKEKFEYDLYYMKNRNIFMDFGILIRTAQIIFKH